MMTTKKTILAIIISATIAAITVGCGKPAQQTDIIEAQAGSTATVTEIESIDVHSCPSRLSISDIESIEKAKSVEPEECRKLFHENGTAHEEKVYWAEDHSRGYLIKIAQNSAYALTYALTSDGDYKYKTFLNIIDGCSLDIPSEISKSPHAELQTSYGTWVTTNLGSNLKIQLFTAGESTRYCTVPKEGSLAEVIMLNGYDDSKMEFFMATGKSVYKIDLLGQPEKVFEAQNIEVVWAKGGPVFFGIAENGDGLEYNSKTGRKTEVILNGLEIQKFYGPLLKAEEAWYLRAGQHKNKNTASADDVVQISDESANIILNGIKIGPDDALTEENLAELYYKIRKDSPEVDYFMLKEACECDYGWAQKSDFKNH